MSDLVVIGSPSGERADAYAASLRRVGRAYTTTSWWSVLAGGPQPVPAGAVVRLETPSDDLRVDAELVRLGGGDPTGLERGRLMRSDHWYAGLQVLLGRLDDALAAAPEHRRLQPTADVLAMFDKAETNRRLVEAGVRVPEPADLADDGQVFVKARYGSSGTGLLAVRRSRGRVITRSTVALVDGVPHNVRRPQVVHGPEALAELLGVLGPHLVQRWVPKARLDRSPGDFRVVVIAGRARQVLARVTESPFSNLHLGARRGHVPTIRETLGTRFDEVLAAAEAAAACFDSHHCGVDVLLPPTGAPYVLEVNAFGDFHEGVVDVDGLDTYQAELALLEEAPCR